MIQSDTERAGLGLRSSFQRIGCYIRELIHPVCAQCGGEGGSEGYYGGDWTGCFCCNPEEDREEPVTRIWFWQVWRNRYECWKLDRWVDRQMKAEREANFDDA